MSLANEEISSPTCIEISAQKFIIQQKK